MAINPVLGAALIQGGSGLLGSWLGRGSNKDSLRFAAKSALYGVRWRVADAIAAGIHPLAALGINPASGPIGTGGVSDRQALGRGIQDMGQSIADYMARMKTPEQKEAINVKMQQEKERLKGMQVENQILEKQLKDLNKAPSVPVNIPGTAVYNRDNITGQGDIYNDRYVRDNDPGVGFTLNPPKINKGSRGVEYGQHQAERATVLGGKKGPMIVYAPSEVNQEMAEESWFYKRYLDLALITRHFRDIYSAGEPIYKMPEEMPEEGKTWVYDRKWNTYRQVPLKDYWKNIKAEESWFRFLHRLKKKNQKFKRQVQKNRSKFRNPYQGF